jgi:hypothetical protein
MMIRYIEPVAYMVAIFALSLWGWYSLTGG